MFKKLHLFLFLYPTLFALVIHGLYFLPTKLDVGLKPEIGNFTAVINKDKSISGSFFTYKALNNIKVGTIFLY